MSAVTTEYELTPEEQEELRLEELSSPLFDLLIRFEHAFARLAIDKYDLSDEDAEKMAAKIAGVGGPGGMGDAFAYFLRRIPGERNMRRLGHMFAAVSATQTVEMISIPDLVNEYNKLQKGEA